MAAIGRMILALGLTTFMAQAVTNRYIRIEKACVNGHNIVKYAGRTVEECAQICSANPNCAGFEYGVAYGGSIYQSGDCQPQSSGDYRNCNGAAFNLDFYLKVATITTSEASTTIASTTITITTTTSVKATTTVAPTTAAPTTTQAFTCGAFSSQDCLNEHSNAVSAGNITGFCNHCINETGANPLRNECNLCCSECQASKTSTTITSTTSAITTSTSVKATTVTSSATITSSSISISTTSVVTTSTSIATTTTTASSSSSRRSSSTTTSTTTPTTTTTTTTFPIVDVSIVAIVTSARRLQQAWQDLLEKTRNGNQNGIFNNHLHVPSFSSGAANNEDGFVTSTSTSTTLSSTVRSPFTFAPPTPAATTPAASTQAPTPPPTTPPTPPMVAPIVTTTKEEAHAFELLNTPQGEDAVRRGIASELGLVSSSVQNLRIYRSLGGGRRLQIAERVGIDFRGVGVSLAKIQAPEVNFQESLDSSLAESNIPVSVESASVASVTIVALSAQPCLPTVSPIMPRQKAATRASLTEGDANSLQWEIIACTGFGILFASAFIFQRVRRRRVAPGYSLLSASEALEDAFEMNVE